MMVSRYYSMANGVRPSSACHRKTWAGTMLAVGALLAPAALTQAEDIDFLIDSGRVVPTEDFAIKVSVLGAAITSGGDDLPVTLEVNINGESYQPFGPHNDPNEGNVNDHSPVRHFIVQDVFDPETTIDVTGTSWRFDGNVHLQRNSHEQSSSVIVLRDGDPVPDISGFDDQTDAVEFVQQYIDPTSNTMSLDINQSIYLFEIGTTKLYSSAADFQDLVVLVTLGKTPEDLENEDNPPDDENVFADASFD